MSKKYVNNDGTLNTYQENLKDFRSYEGIVFKETKISIGHDFLNTTGAVSSSGGGSPEYRYDHMIFASTGTTPSLTDRLFKHPKVGNHFNNASRLGSFGGAIVASGNSIAVLHKGNLDDTPEDSFRDRQGVFIFNSSSEGWQYSDAIFPSASIYPRTNESDSSTDGFAVARSFDYDGTHLTIGGIVDGGMSAEDNNDVLYVYKSGGAGWVLEATLSTASFLPGLTFSYSAASQDYYIRDGTYGLFNGHKVYNGKIIAGGLDFADRSTGSEKRHSGAAVFASSSGGWAYETFLTSSFSHSANDDVTHEYRKGSGTNAGSWCGNIDYDGQRVIIGGYGGYNNTAHLQQNGRVTIWNSASSGWYEETQIDLRSAGLTDTVAYGTGDDEYNIYQIEIGSSPHDGAKEYKLYHNFGYFGCTISGSYVAASAIGYNSGGNTRSKVKNRIFIFKSSSASGWGLQDNFKSPNTNTGGLGSRGTTHYDDEFGYHIIFDKSFLGHLMTRSLSYRNVTSSSNNTLGRVYLYRQANPRSDGDGAGSWSLIQTIENPYSGSLAPFSISGNRNDYEQYGDHAPDSRYKQPDLLGFDNGNLIVPFSHIAQSENDSGSTSDQYRWGAVQILKSTERFSTTTDRVTETIQQIEKGGRPDFVPFRFLSNGAPNLRLGGVNGIKTFIGVQKS